MLRLAIAEDCDSMTTWTYLHSYSLVSGISVYSYMAVHHNCSFLPTRVPVRVGDPSGRPDSVCLRTLLPDIPNAMASLLGPARLNRQG